jgi:TatD DNase family protein
MLTDTHAHINLHAFKDDADEVLRRSLDAGVAVINVGTELHTSRQAVEMLANYPNNVYATVGLHPSHTYDNPHLDENESAFATGREEFDYEAYKSLASQKKVVGVGECGLDYYRLGDANNTNEHANDTNKIKEQQKNAFLQQIKLAQELDKALVVHCRPSKGSNDAYDDVLEILNSVLSSSRMRGSSSPPSEQPGVGLGADVDSRLRGNDRAELRFEIHSFTGPVEIAQQFIELGGYIGLNGIITFDKTGNMEQVIKGVPLERMVLETDSPYLSPLPYRGKRNEPINVQEVAKKIAEWKGIELSEVEAATTRNAAELFKLSI